MKRIIVFVALLPVYVFSMEQNLHLAMNFRRMSLMSLPLPSHPYSFNPAAESAGYPYTKTPEYPYYPVQQSKKAVAVVKASINRELVVDKQDTNICCPIQ